MEDSSLLSDSSIISNFSGCISEVSTDTESSWTPYIVDFVIHNTTTNDNVGSLSNHEDDDDNTSAMKMKMKKKRKKTNQVDDDEALEDTASSPGNSPKVFCIERQDGSSSYRTKRDHPLNFNNILEEKNIFEQRKVLAIDDTRRRETSESRASDSESALKKKGLRLVPVSMLVKCQDVES